MTSPSLPHPDVHASAAVDADVAGHGQTTAMPPFPAGPATGASLRLKLHLIVATLMVLFTVTLLWQHVLATRASVREEITASNRVATQVLQRVAWIVSRGGPQAALGFLSQLERVRANEITLTDDNGQEVYRSPPSVYKEGRDAPDWYASLVMPPVQRQTFAFGTGTLTIEADPSRAILDGWDDLVRMLVVAAVVLLLLNVAVFAAVGRTLRPLRQIVVALRRMQRGDYATRLPTLPGRESRVIGEAVNQLAATIEDQVQQRVRTLETERRLAESREWAHRIEQRLETERREIASELHDELGQSVTAIRTLARSLAARLPETDPTGRQAAALIDSEAAQLYDAMHGLIPRLTPLALHPLGLPDALADLVASLRPKHAGISFACQSRGMDDAEVAPEAALAAYRVAQEAINNALKHSGGDHITLLLERPDNDQMRLTISDNGRGLPPPEQRHGRFGLTGLRERVQALGGQIHFDDAPGGGARVVATLPITPAVDAAGAAA